MDFAVVGMDCLLPGSRDAETWIKATEPAIRPVPPGRWADSSTVAPKLGTPDRTVSLEGAWLDEEGGLVEWSQHVIGNVLDESGAKPENTHLFLANLSLPSDVPNHSSAPALHAADFFRLANVTSLDAACASGLYAVRLAMDALRSGACDTAIAAGVQAADPTYLLVGFSQLLALSPTGTPLPLDRRANGLVVGEGAAAVLLKRLPDALAAGNRIHAVIRDGGLGNDGRKGNLLAPDADGQLRAMTAAWEGLDPRELGYVECHATGTKVGDGTEMKSLVALLEAAGDPGHPVAVSSAKRLIGHTITVAGLAGLIRTIGAVRDGFVPAGPAEPLDLIADSAHLRVASKRETWPKGVPRRAAVSAFGFGGTNAHVIVERAPQPKVAKEPRPSAPSERQGLFGLRAGLRRLLDRDRGEEVPPEPIQIPAAPPPAELVETPRLAVIGFGGQIGTRRHEALVDAWASGRSLVDGAGKAHVDAVHVDPRRWRIPPLELAAMLPQQVLAMEIGADALEVAGVEDRGAAVIMGMELDPRVTAQVTRLKDDDPSVAPALSAQRVQGQLPNFVANRLSAQLDLQGPSYTVSAGAASGVVALEQAARLIANGAVETAVVGAVDVAGPCQGALALVVKRYTGDEDGLLGVLDLHVGDDGEPATLDAGCLTSLLAVAEGLFTDGARVAQPMGKATTTVTVDKREGRSLELAARKRTLAIPNRHVRPASTAFGPGADTVVLRGTVDDADAPLAWSRWVGGRKEQVVDRSIRRKAPARRPKGLPAAAEARVPFTPADSRPPPSPLRGSVGDSPTASVRRERPRTSGLAHSRVPTVGESVASPRADVPRPHTARKVVEPPRLPEPKPLEQPLPVAAPELRADVALAGLQTLDELAQGFARSNAAVTQAHGQFLEARRSVADQLARMGRALAMLDGTAFDDLLGSTGPLPSAPAPVVPQAPVLPTPSVVTPPVAPVVRAPEPVATDFRRGVPRQYDRAALLRHASGKLSEVFGPTFADQDPFEPRTRMPEPPLLLCSRVLDIEGTPNELGPSRIITEYDLPTDENWSHHDGKPNACVIVESGQADLFLVSYLGIEQHCRGERVYRLLDCDLTFHGPRPQVGETLHHDIRIKRFARLGSKILFYFEYDCTANTDGRQVLTMRNGCAGFFTPAELATPHGLDPEPAPLERAPTPVTPRLTGNLRALDEDEVLALVEGRFSDAFGPGVAAADGSRLTLPNSEWRLVHRIQAVQTSGGPYGLGLARYEQVLRDDDWFNAGHFKGDPCMPGTLMLEGCLQAVQVWLLGAGVAADFPDGMFEPLPDLAFELRCRGQVVPGHSSLVYEARIKEASLDGTPYAIADVLLSVDGTPVVLAKNVGVTIGTRLDAAAEPVPSRDSRVAEPLLHADRAPGEPVVDVRRVYEYSIGDAERAFGSRYADYAGIEPRCARMPGPPLLQMTRVIEAENPFVVEQGAEVAIEYDVPEDAWFFDLTPGSSMPFAILLETALQPCGWLTAWQAAGIKDGRNLYFRNLGGEATQHVEVWPDAGTLTTRTKQTVVAQSAGLLIHNFALEVHCGDVPVYSCTTSFGYFTNGALDGQKGLGLKDEDRRAAARANGSGRTVDLRAHPSMPRSDWRNLDEVTVVDEQGGKAGLGFYEAVKHIDPAEWFFTAHFFLDPVMPGSLGLEAALQLARFVLEDRTGRKERVTPIRLGVPHTWKYRGQMRRPVQTMSLELEVTSLTDEEIVFDAVLRADGVPIYEMLDFGLTAVPERAPVLEAAPPAGPAVAALLDSFEVQGGQGTGHVHLDPDRFPWLRDHCPTVTAPAVPMAFASEIAAEAALQLRPGAKVVGVPVLEAEKWIHTGEGPLDLLVVAVLDGDQVAVSLAVHVDNHRFPKLSGPKVHMKAVVQLGDAWPVAPALPEEPAVPRVPMTVEQYYGGGLTFHGPTLQGMVDVGVRGGGYARATFATRPDAELNGAGHGFVLDPLLLDTATHPMFSGEPELWDASVGSGKLAYPVRAEGMTFYGPRPSGRVDCRLALVDADAHTLAFDVVLVGSTGVWSSFRWTEALVPGGPVLGRPTPERKAFIWDEQPVETVRIGRSVGNRWRVEQADLVEPIEGTLVGLYCTGAERRQLAATADPSAWILGRLAAKEAARARLMAGLRDVHPKQLTMLDLRPDRTIVTNARGLTAQEWIDHLGPTRFHLCVEVRDGAAEAWFEDTGWPT